jgi:hypothetical protein
MPESLHDKTMREHGERYAEKKKSSGYTGTGYTRKRSFWKEQKEDLKDKLNCLGGCLGTIVGITFFLGGLWLLVAVVKWMWQHS